METFPTDLRERVYKAWRAGEGSSREIAERFGVSDSFVRKLALLHRRHGTIDPRPPSKGRKPVLTSRQRERLIELARREQNLSCSALKARLQLHCCETTVWRELKKAGFSFKRRSSKPLGTGAAMPLTAATTATAGATD